MVDTCQGATLYKRVYSENVVSMSGSRLNQNSYSVRTYTYTRVHIVPIPYRTIHLGTISELVERQTFHMFMAHNSPHFQAHLSTFSGPHISIALCINLMFLTCVFGSIHMIPNLVCL